MQKQKIHYAGAVQTPTMNILPGWAACCSGHAAYAIRRAGAHTRAVSAVTCKKCLRVMHQDPSIEMEEPGQEDE
jgi:hypothetical protein